MEFPARTLSSMDAMHLHTSESDAAIFPYECTPCLSAIPSMLRGRHGLHTLVAFWPSAHYHPHRSKEKRQSRSKNHRLLRRHENSFVQLWRLVLAQPAGCVTTTSAIPTARTRPSIRSSTWLALKRRLSPWLLG